MKKQMIILVGIPCSGKSSAVRKIKKEHPDVVSVSRDELREVLFGKDYLPTTAKEEEVTRAFDKVVNSYLKEPEAKVIILDNTHCKEKYINEIIHKYKPVCDLQISRFPVFLWEAHLRNIYRWMRTGKWIPWRVMNAMDKNYNNINWGKYAEYMVH